MPRKNTLKDYIPLSFYHIYNRGVDKRQIFQDSQDYNYFLYLFDRYLSTERKVNKIGYSYPNFYGELDLVCFCLMPNHIHLLIFVYEKPEVLWALMSSMLTSYSMYFNKKYHRAGSLFENPYKAKRIHEDEYYIHISRYIHMNPNNWQTYTYSSLNMLYVEQVSWLKTDAITDIFKTQQDYLKFMHDYDSKKQELKKLKHEFDNGQ